MADDLTRDDLHEWVLGLDALFGRMESRFARAELRRQARMYVLGLMAPIERKNGLQLAEAAGETSPDRMQRLLNGSRWDPRLVRADLRGYVMDHLGHRDGVLIVGETAFLRKGNKSAGVQRQYCSALARVENCQLGVFLAYASPLGHALIDAELYLPKSWTDDRTRCAQVGIGEEVIFATKPVLARQMVARALDAGAPLSWVTAIDADCGMDHRFRRFLEESRLSYVVAVPMSQSLGIGWSGDTRVDTVTSQAPTTAWKRPSCGDGTGARMYEWAVATVHLVAEPGYQRWLLVRRSLVSGGMDESELAYYLCHAPIGTTLEDLIAVAGSRRAFEECFQSARQATGLDDYQVRRYDAWHRHITLAMLAHAYLTIAAVRPPRARAAWPPSHQQKPLVSWHT